MKNKYLLMLLSLTLCGCSVVLPTSEKDSSSSEKSITTSEDISSIEEVSKELESSSLSSEEVESFFEVRQMKTHHYAYDNILQVDTYYRSDTLTKLPYISLKNFYHLLLNKDLVIDMKAEGIYEVTNPNNESAYINTTLDTLECSDYQNFISTTIYRQEGVPNVYFDGAPFIRINHVEEDKAPKKTTINFNKYGIDLFGVEDDIILPLVTASNIFSGPTMLTCHYDKNDIYFIDPNDPDYETDDVTYSTEHRNGILDFFEDNKRTDDEARFSYGELCFLIDTYYGLPGREYLHEELLETRDLDAVLNSYNDDTRTCRELLLSTDMIDYFAGLQILDYFLNDAGHTVINYGADIIAMYDSSISKKVSTKLASLGIDEDAYSAKRNASYNYRIELSSARSQFQLKDNSSLIQGDTLIYRFDYFDFNVHEWNYYYANIYNSDLPEDALGNFVRALEYIKDNDEIKNVVLDISTNGGGFGDLVVAFMGLISQKTYLRTHDTINDNNLIIHYDFDANFDGKFDELDKEVKYDFNFAILCSTRSFSCGNLLPSQAKDNGIMVIGDKSGGGACALIDAVSAEGLYIRMSCTDHMIGKDGEVDMGVEADCTLVTYLDNDRYDFSKFYDLTIISEEMHNFYNN